ncbi:hypothetical protein V1502_11195 [Bacillus sp. SCS-153A]|uniref:hypothetical protein n=1 Tax=Rossellomorea sedimentorum TaxID=3115294 RepID=UPI003906667E
MENHHSHHHDAHMHMQNAEGGVKTTWDVNPAPVNTDQEAEIVLSVKNEDGSPSTKFALVHEKEMHMLLISEDLSEFMHLHPEYIGEGQFKTVVEFEKAGVYKIYADFQPEGKGQQITTHTIEVEGNKGEATEEDDFSEEKTIGDLSFRLELDHKQANQQDQMTFSVSDGETGQPINALEPYLGSAGHVVIVSEKQEEFLHVHPINEKSTGPEVTYAVTFPFAGKYKVWGQFKYKGDLYTVPFLLTISG